MGKKKLTDTIDEVFQEDPCKYVFIGDGAYHNTLIRTFFARKGYLAILPMKHLTRRYNIRLNTVTDIKIKQRLHAVFEDIYKQNGFVRHEIIQLIPVKNQRYKEFNHWTFVINIITNTTRLKDGSTSTAERRFLTNIDLPCTSDNATKFRALIRQHWQVETFHQYKDVNFKEDKYFKARHKAGYKSIINNFARLVQTLCGVNTKHDIENLKMYILLLAVLLVIFLDEQH